MSNYYRSLIQYGSSFDFLTNLVAWYDFENNANDLTGNGHNGTVTGSAYVSGKNNLCIDFGTGSIPSYVRIADNNNFSFTNGGGIDVACTIAMWAKFNFNNFGGHWLINKRDATSGGDEWQFMYFGGKIHFTKFDQLSNSRTQSASFAFTPVLGTWYHLCYTDNGSKTFSGMKIYLNGISQTLTNDSSGTYSGMSNGSSQITIGSMNWNLGDTGFKHKGFIDGLGVWKGRELNSLEVGGLNAGSFYPF